MAAAAGKLQDTCIWLMAPSLRSGASQPDSHSAEGGRQGMYCQQRPVHPEGLGADSVRANARPARGCVGCEDLLQPLMHSAGGALRDRGQDAGLWGGMWGQVLLQGLPRAGLEGRSSEELQADEGNDDEGLPGKER